MSQAAELKLEQIGAVLRRGTKGSVLLADLSTVSHENLAEWVFECLRELPKLKELILAGLPITDQMFKQLSGAESLQSIDLNSTAISDRSVTLLSTFPKLSLVQLGSTEVSSEAVAEARKKMIETRIVFR